jgi:tRNA-specific 2-thiouridylase
MPSLANAKTVKAGKVIVGMSGGVDSSVSAYLLIQAGYEVEGLFMKNWEEDDGTEYCTAIADLADAQQVCDRLDIPLHSANFAAEYWDNVFEHFLSEYKANRTPNPDILCNREIKFKAFLEYAESLGADFIATGHYARLDRQNGSTRLLKGLDNNKDQSYFLHAVEEEAFAKSIFPIGEIEKREVREIAEAQGFITHNKKDSTGICFIGERRFKDFLETYLPAQPGKIRSFEGQILGDHDGLMYYTIGQRQGLEIGGVSGAQEDAWYVCDKNILNNELIVVQGGDHSALMSSGLNTGSLHFINGEPEDGSLICMAKTRYRQPDQACKLTKTDSGWHVSFERPQRAVTPGQSLVLYQDDFCLGGGVIENTEPI